jgi:hypothetical protein
MDLFEKLIIFGSLIITCFTYTVLFKGLITFTLVETSSFIIGYLFALDIFVLTYFAFDYFIFLVLFFRFFLYNFLEPLFFTLIEWSSTLKTLDLFPSYSFLF